MYMKLAIIAGALTALTACAHVDGRAGMATDQPEQAPQTGVQVSGLAYVGVTHRTR